MVAFALSIVLVISSISLVIANPRENNRKTTRSVKVVSQRNENGQIESDDRATEVEYTKFAGKMKANGREIKFDIPPVVKSGTTLIPVRAVVESLGANVNWDAATNTVTITKGGTTIVFDLNGSKVYVNGSEVTLSMPAMEISNRTFVPIRFIAETLGVNINYDDKTGDVDIEDGSQQGSTVSQSVYGQTDETVSQGVYNSDDTVTNNVYGEQDNEQD